MHVVSLWNKQHAYRYPDTVVLHACSHLIVKQAYRYPDNVVLHAWSHCETGIQIPRYCIPSATCMHLIVKQTYIQILLHAWSHWETGIEIPRCASLIVLQWSGIQIPRYCSATCMLSLWKRHTDTQLYRYPDTVLYCYMHLITDTQTLKQHDLIQIPRYCSATCMISLWNRHTDTQIL